MKRSLFVLMSALSLILYGCTWLKPSAKTESPASRDRGVDVAIEPKANPWSSLELHNNPNNFQFAIVTDNTGGARAGVFEDAVARLNLIEPEFVMSVGDLIQGYSSDHDKIDRMWNEFTGYIDKLNVPFFYVPGNHDLSNKTMQEEWHKRFGRTYYHFRYRDVLFLCLNSEDPPNVPGGTISADQLAYVRKALEENSDVRWTLLFLHRPMWIGSSRQNGWGEIEKLLGDRKYTVFAGHLHSYVNYDLHDRQYVDLATTGGATVRTPDDLQINEMRVILGSFDEVAWVTMTDDGPQIANLLLDGIWASDLRTPETAGWTRSLLEQVPLYLESILTSDKVFSRGRTTLRVVNRSDFALTMRGRVEPGTALKARPDDVMLQLPPKSDQEIDIALSSDQPLNVGEHLPLLFYWSLEYETAGAPKLDMRKNLKLRGLLRGGVLGTEKLAAQTTPVKIDGKLDDWSDLPHVCEQPQQIWPGKEFWHGPADGSFRFATTMDDKFLYVAIRVTDDAEATASRKTEQMITGVQGVETDSETISATPRQEIWLRDGIELRLDARPDPQRSHSRVSKNVDQMILVGLDPPMGGEKAKIYKANRSAVDIAAACVRCQGGYSAEVAIPLSYFAKHGGDNWKNFRLNIAVNDFDDNGDSFSQIWWRPDWSKDANYLGSGTFAR